LLLGACGYQFKVGGPGPTIGTPQKTAAPDKAPTMAVVLFENRSSEPNLEVRYTNYARNEFASGVGAKMVADPSAAELVLRGQIISVILPTLTFTLTQGTLESRVTVRVRGVVEDARTKKVIWSYITTGMGEFFVTNDLQFNRVLQQRALEQAGVFAAEDLANRFLNHLETYGLAPAPAPPAVGAAEPAPAAIQNTK
jgi:hypothetical protein